MPTHPAAVSPYNRPVQPPSVYPSSLPPPFPPTSISPSPGYDMYSVPPHPHMYMMQVSVVGGGGGWSIGSRAAYEVKWGVFVKVFCLILILCVPL